MRVVDRISRLRCSRSSSGLECVLSLTETDIMLHSTASEKSYTQYAYEEEWLLGSEQYVSVDYVSYFRR